MIFPLAPEWIVAVLPMNILIKMDGEKYEKIQFIASYIPF